MTPDQIRSMFFEQNGKAVLVCWGNHPGHPNDSCILEELTPIQIVDLLFHLQAAYCNLYTDVKEATCNLEQSAETFDLACKQLRESIKRGSE